MRISHCGIAMLLISILNASPRTALAQQSFGNNNSTASSAAAPVYSQNNFKADARSDNLYSYKNPTSQIKAPWNTFQMQVKQLGAQAAPAVPPKPQQAQSSNDSSTMMTMTGYNGMQTISRVSSNMFKPTTTPPPAPAASSNNLNGQNGLSSTHIMGPNNSENPDTLNSELQNSNSSVTGTVKTPLAESVPGLLPQ